MVTDARVEHEYNLLKEAGAKSIRVEASRETRAKRGTLIGEDDITETGLDHIKDWDYVVDNNKDYEHLEKQLDKIIEDLK